MTLTKRIQTVTDLLSKELAAYGLSFGIIQTNGRTVIKAYDRFNNSVELAYDGFSMIQTMEITSVPFPSHETQIHANVIRDRILKCLRF